MAWDDVKLPNEIWLSADYNAMVTNQKSRPRTATRVVAASNSLDTTNADYICDGVADEAEINTAIGDLPATGGSVLLMDGTYNITTPIIILKDNVTLMGQGRNTLIFLVANSDCNVINISDANQRYGSRITNLRIYGNRTNQGAGNWNGIHIFNIDYCKVDHCWIENVDYNAINSTTPGANFVIISNNHFYNVGNVGVAGTFMSYLTICDNIFMDCYYGVTLAYGAATGNTFYNGYTNFYSCKSCAVTGNFSQGASYFWYSASSQYEMTITGNSVSGSIYMNGSHDAVVNGNFIKNRSIITVGTAHNISITGNVLNGSATAGIIVGGQNISVVGNTLYEIAQDGIQLNGADHCTISSNNLRRCGDSWNNTYAGILLTGTATYNIVSDNRVYSAYANKHKYGIREAAVADDWNLIHGNTLTDAVTANLSSQGPNSVTADNIAP